MCSSDKSTQITRPSPGIIKRVFRKGYLYGCYTRKHYLCLNKNLHVALYEGKNFLNKKTELITKPRRQNKFMLLRHESKD